MEISYEKQATKSLAKMPVKTALLIRKKILSFAEKDGKLNVDIKAMKGVEDGFRMRQGDWRVLMAIDGKILRVMAVKPRGDAYK